MKYLPNSQYIIKMNLLESTSPEKVARGIRSTKQQPREERLNTLELKGQSPFLSNFSTDYKHNLRTIRFILRAFKGFFLTFLLSQRSSETRLIQQSRHFWRGLAVLTVKRSCQNL